MAEPATLSALLQAQSERKLTKMREGIVAELDRLRLELRLVDDALGKKRKATTEKPERRAADSSAEPVEKMSPQPKPTNNGRFQGLSREELFGYMVELGRPAKPAQVARYLLDEKSIVRTTEAVRVGLSRLEKDGRLARGSDGEFYVPRSNGGAPRPETEAPSPTGMLDFGSSNPDESIPGE